MQVHQQRQKLHDLQNLIDNLGSQDTVSDKAFEDRLKEAEKTIMDLLKEAQQSKGIQQSQVLHPLFQSVPQHSYFFVLTDSCRGGQRPP